MTQFSSRPFLLKTDVQGFYLRLPFQLATPPEFHATHIPKGNLVTILDSRSDIFLKRWVYRHKVVHR